LQGVVLPFRDGYIGIHTVAVWVWKRRIALELRKDCTTQRRIGLLLAGGIAFFVNVDRNPWKEGSRWEAPPVRSVLPDGRHTHFTPLQ